MKKALYAALFMAAVACNNGTSGEHNGIDTNVNTSEGLTSVGDPAGYQPDSLPPPHATESVRKESNVIGWPEGKTPVAPAGFSVTKFAGNLNNPRSIYQAPNGDIFIAEAKTKGNSADNILILRDANNDGIAEFKQDLPLNNLEKPYGVLVMNNALYVANTGGLYKYPYTPGSTAVKGEGKKILNLPAGGYNNHWTRNLIASPDSSKIYVSVGSGSNVGEHGMDNEVRRANILQINPDGSGEVVYASGLRNPVGMDWAPGTNTLWTVVNERDELGDNLVPDYLTSVKKGAFYGWPYAYIGPHPDPEMGDKAPDLVKKTIKPDVLLGAHTASLGLAFYHKNTFPSKYHNGAFVGQHGSWNRSEFAGYKVIFVPFNNGNPSGSPENFLTGFIDKSSKNDVYGRPVDVCVLQNGSLLVADDAGNTIWRIAYTGKK